MQDPPPRNHSPLVLSSAAQVDHVLVADAASAISRNKVPFIQGRDLWLEDSLLGQPGECPIEWMDAEAPLFKVKTPSILGCNHRTTLSAPNPRPSMFPCSSTRADPQENLRASSTRPAATWWGHTPP